MLLDAELRQNLAGNLFDGSMRGAEMRQLLVFKKCFGYGDFFFALFDSGVTRIGLTLGSDLLQAYRVNRQPE